MSESKWLNFVTIGDTGKTVIVVVESKTLFATLGQIKWFGRWRQYAFFPSRDTCFNLKCLEDIGQKIKELMDERKKR